VWWALAGLIVLLDVLVDYHNRVWAVIDGILLVGVLIALIRSKRKNVSKPGLSSGATNRRMGGRQQHPPRKRILLALISYAVAVCFAYSAAHVLAIYVAVFLGVLLLIWIIFNPAHRGSNPTQYRIFRSDQ
jgi:hypothetical protein